jgi:maltooligosyltrehalose trehalohydrolase
MKDGHTTQRRMPVGAEPIEGSGAEFRIWAPRCSRVDVVLRRDSREEAHPMDREPGGYFRGTVSTARAGTRYGFRLDGEGEGERKVYPDPASRFQPDGPHGLSEVIDPGAFEWSDADWRGVSLAGQVLYEMHIGTFTRAGTWASATAELPELARLGVTLLEIMPIAEFPGRFGWGYDGVNLFAPTRLYGSPDDARRFVDRAHSLGLGVILDVVYNHVGPDGNYLTQFSDDYFSARHRTDWGKAINYDGHESAPVREFFLANAAYWVREYHFDGLRLDATQDIHDESADPILAAIGRAVREAAGTREVVIVAENEPQDARLVRSAARGGLELDGIWNDDFHHTARVCLTGHREAYYTDYGGTPQELVSALKRGFLYQGQYYGWQKKRRGAASLDVPPWRFITFLENHDQVANTATGARLWALSSPGRHRALVALFLLGPGTPMLFQGEEFASSRPFLYFADHGPQLASLVESGRREFLAQFPSVAHLERVTALASPHDPATFERCKLDGQERNAHVETYALYRDLIALRRRQPAFGGKASRPVDGAVLGAHALVVRLFADGDDDRLIVTNLGPDETLARAPEPLLAPPEGHHWEVVLSTEDPRYGGAGAPAVEHAGGWSLRGESTTVLAAVATEGE